MSEGVCGEQRPEANLAHYPLRLHLGRGSSGGWEQLGRSAWPDQVTDLFTVFGLGHAGDELPRHHAGQQPGDSYEQRLRGESGPTTGVAGEIEVHAQPDGMVDQLMCLVPTEPL